MTTSNQQEIINQTIKYVKEILKNAEGGHDWWHVHRVWNTAKTIAEQEDVDSFVVDLAALLHDIADRKFHNNDEEIGPKRAHQFMLDVGVDKDRAEHVKNIIANMSFKGGQQRQFDSLELQVAQDADFLDAIGAVGIGRTFSYGGFVQQPMYSPEIPPKLNMTKEEYYNSISTTVNHFYEKLLTLKDRMNTKTGRKMAEGRHKLMEEFLQRFYDEFDGKK